MAQIIKNATEKFIQTCQIINLISTNNKLENGKQTNKREYLSGKVCFGESSWLSLSLIFPF